MFQVFEKIVLGMAMIRILSGVCEVSAAFLMLRFNSVEKALLINSTLSIIGPFIFFSTMSLGLVGITAKISTAKLLWIVAGLGLIIYGIRK
ncbi:YqhV family protein [Fictibacillus enclensis]|uniref:DUF2619 domain-containing protein n=1 Tax=Fictibacillus enclensis TaxID=1017270 RepID=A0A0V8J874_9BACL|nr:MULTISPECIES: YqhV family protein [Fictibacillus]KSU83124.1 hypothetical protein AS030_11080 [Fictibacillus enclensis]MDM5200684.1 YqhV family protein [Fictibacillus enclensis]MDM5340040.1 YqhV family protein [Fictibacillus enclensis]RXZ01876.1 DUF2619 domain-containing protein [Fictibacillus sp. S7]WHY71566.1 YqhV family protein [Fictibacillus enclensis]